MNKIKVRTYKTCYDLHLLPALVLQSNAAYECGAEQGTARIYRFLTVLIDKLDLPKGSQRYFRNKIKYMETSGGFIASLAVAQIDINSNKLPLDSIELDLGYCITKEVQLYIGSVNITRQLHQNQLLTCLVEKIVHEIYNYHEKHYFYSREGESFVEQLFLTDNVNVMVNENCSIDVNIELSLRDYLLNLNERLSISA